MKQRSSEPLVLEYKKRRFDGGSERDIIEQIEQQYKVYEQHQLSAGLQPQSVLPPHLGATHSLPFQHPHPRAGNPLPPPNPIQPGRMSVQQKLYKAFIMPYVEFVLGLSGVLIGGIMVVTLMQGAAITPEILAQERQALVQQSWTVVRNSIGQMICAPFIAMGLLMQK